LRSKNELNTPADINDLKDVYQVQQVKSNSKAAPIVAA